MTQPKTHYLAYEGTLKPTACGRGQRMTADVYRVTCNLCRDKAEYSDALHEAAVARKAAFDAQEPRMFREPWYREVVYMACNCGSELFRQGDRTCYGHYDNFVCDGCGRTTSRLTEKGMSY